MATVFPSRRVRRTPFSAGVEAAGMSVCTIYNRMILPSVFASQEEDYRHLKTHVQVWDVACERQVAVQGPDARRLLDLISPRDLDRMAADQCYYMPAIDREGGMLNDPVLVKLAEDHFWISLADSDYLQYVLGVSDGLGMDVHVWEPDVSPLAVQGPKSDELMARVFGEEARSIRFFRYKRLAFEGQSFVVARSGYSKQGGFEIYVEGSEHGMPLWNALMKAGEDLNVRAGCPSTMERVEGGLLSYGNDMRRENTPFECGLGKYVNSPRDYIGKAGLMARSEPERQIRPVEIFGEIPPITAPWPLLADGRRVGQVTTAAWSPDFKTNVSIGMVERSHWDAGQKLEIETPQGMRRAEVKAGFWI
ncbi:dimethylsulfoniopropionate demethylase [Defluviimonas sp. WL0002]|uniref:Dimethylsulfoniopropionate demethylase n=1 Tax=Albidovulum marisflavi TaxID=2984159 RepID=A0ABT2ZCU5_9RHOB|nr:dimethylsulfoniopropionate demethylase [Defluviimonas sp. WL0002]MCV2868949.1 dimethylsulfoniopropionate demethylase [Defluviimonas sp. WL0002]